jgi:hypothetical protein
MAPLLVLVALGFIGIVLAGRLVPFVTATTSAMPAMAKQVHAYKHDADQKPEPVLIYPFHDIASLSYAD